MSEQSRSFVHDDYTVGWICALPETELLAAAAMLDEEHPMLPAADPRDTNSYLLGRIGAHNIVIACLPAQTTGKVSAATVANNLSRSFPAVRFGLMVGIGGGAPYYGSKEEATSDYSEEEDSEDEEEEEIRDIRRGDIVVSLHSKASEAVVQYDFGKSIQGAEFIRAGGRLDKPPAIILSAVAMLQQQHRRKGTRITELMIDAVDRNPGVAAEFKCPGAAKDRFFKSGVVHVQGKKTCKSCCGKDDANLVMRKERTTTGPEIHYGTIGSADQVMKDAFLRDKWGRSEGILCFEMEAAGLMDSFPCLVIRGICDYADSHKDKIWQSYAAATAAAYAKELVLVIPEQGIMGLPPIKQFINQLARIEETTITIKDSVISSQQEQYREEILSWISPLDYSSKQNDTISRRQLGTGMWFLDSPIFARWLETEKQTLFCPGIPGAGKTIMAASVIAKIQHQLCHGNGGLAYIYCTYNERHTARDLIASILKQLSSQLPAIPQKVNELYTAHKVHRSSLQMNDLRSALISVLSCFPKVFIVIDAIDECQDDKNRAELLEAVRELKPHASILVTSRHSGAIEDAFEQDFWLEIEASATDIETYVGSQIHKRDFVLSNELADNSDLRSCIINAIVSKSRGMFLHAEFHVKFLATKHNLRDLEDALEELPMTSSAIYQQAMQRMQAQSLETVTLAQKMLSWIICAVEPMKIRRLQNALALREGDVLISQHAYTSSRYLLSICAGLVIVDKETEIIRLVHYTAQEYLEKHQAEYLPHAQDEVSGTCLRYLSLNIADSPDWLIAVPETSDMFYYAATNLGKHLLDGAAPFVIDQAVKLFEDRKSISRAIEKGMHLPRSSDIRRPNRLHYAVSLSLSHILHLLHPTPEEINETNGDGDTPLCYALGHPTTTQEIPYSLSDYELLLIAKTLIQKGAQIESRDGQGSTPLAVATRRGNHDLVKFLLSAGASVHVVDKYGKSVLMFAAEGGHHELVAMLLERGAAVNMVDHYGQTALSRAGVVGHKEVVKLLLAKGAVADGPVDAGSGNGLQNNTVQSTAEGDC